MKCHVRAYAAVATLPHNRFTPLWAGGAEPNEKKSQICHQHGGFQTNSQTVNQERGRQTAQPPLRYTRPIQLSRHVGHKRPA